MLKRAQDMLDMMQDGLRTTMRVVADLAESVGVPPAVTALIQPRNGTDQWKIRETGAPPPSVVAVEPAPVSAPEPPRDEARAVPAKRRPVVGDRDRSRSVRPLGVDDAIAGSTYLARIIWTLGVAELEGLGALRPADIARMVMSRSAVSLEPPNVARYIRRSKPSSIVVDRVEGGSSFYKLNERGQKLFREHFSMN
jgi:hypothetical protein